MGLSLLYKGFNYVANYNGDFELGDTYSALEATGINSVGITYENGINPATSSIFQNYDALSGNDIGTDRGFTETQTGLTNQIQQSIGSGQSVFVRPFIDFLDPTVTGVPLGQYQDGDWRQFYRPTSLSAFFKSYTSFIVNQAKMAQAAGATTFDIGTELDQLITAKTMSYWTTLIKDVRAVFTGQLTYSASWIDGGTGGSIATIPTAFWKQLDYVGVDAYVIAPDPNNYVGAWTQPPTDPTLSQAFQGKSAIDYYESVADAAGKPLIITEAGYTDASDAATNPLDQNGTKDPSVQAALYNAFFTAWEQAGVTSLVGVYWTYWAPFSGDGQGIPTDFPPINNPNTISAVQAGFSAPAPYVVTLSTKAQTIGTAIADTTWPLELVITPYTTTNKSGASVANGKVLLTGANTYSGGTLIMAGTIGLGNTQALGTGGLDIIAGELDLNRYSLSLPTLRGGGRIVSTGTSGQPAGVTTLTVGAGTFAGALLDQSTSSTLELIKTGSGTLTLSGQSAYSTTLIEDGTLELATAKAAGGSVISFGSQTATLTIDNAALAQSPLVRGKGYVFGSLLTHFDTDDTIVLDGVSGTPTMSVTTSSGIYNVTLSGLSGIAGGTITLQIGANEFYTSMPSISEVNGNLVLTSTADAMPAAISVAVFASVQKTFNKIAGGFAISDTAAHIIAKLSTLAADAAHITSITSTTGPVTVGTSSLRYQSVLDKVAGGYAILDTGAAIQSHLVQLTADNANISSIDVKSGTVTTSVANFLANESTFDKITGGVTLIDDPTAIAANIAALSADAAHIRTISFGTRPSPVLVLSAEDAASNADLLEKITSPYVLETTSGGTSSLAGQGSHLTFHIAQDADATINGGGTNETFTFDTGPWHATIDDFYQHMTGATHDTIMLSSHDFTNFAAVLQDAVSTSSGTVITSTTTGSELTLTNVTASALAAAKSDFKFN